MQKKVIIISIILIVLIVFIVLTLNRMIKASNKVKASLSGIDVALIKRHDTITKMVEIVKGYVEYEKDVIFRTIQIRKEMSLSEKNKINNLIDEKLSRISFLVENYPEIKANENFMHLQKTIIDLEEHLQASRRLYNSSVLMYNQLIQSFPNLIIAKIFGFKAYNFFQVNEEQKENINILT